MALGRGPGSRRSLPLLLPLPLPECRSACSRDSSLLALPGSGMSDLSKLVCWEQMARFPEIEQLRQIRYIVLRV